MKGRFHKTVLSVSAMLIAFMFASCGDESSTSADEDSVKKDESSVESVSDLGECDETLEGESKFVTEDSTNYTCTSGKWEQNIDTDDDEKSSSSKKGETAASSSSSKKGETAASSSSAKKAETSSSKKEETAASSSSAKKAETSSSEPEDEGIIKPDGYYQTNCPEGKTCSYISTDYLTPSATYGEFLSTNYKVYKTVKIGSQVWMAQNIPSRKCNNEKCWTLGGKNPCPAGWRLPSKSEFETLLANTSGAALKSTTGWTECALSEGSNSSGFSAPADGYYYRTWTGSGWVGDYGGIGSNANFWTSTIEGSEGYVLTIDCDGNTSFTKYYTEEMYASIRCILDEEN